MTTTMGSDHRVQVDMEGGSSAPAGVTVVRQAPPSGARWRVGGALLAIALCVSAALLFTWHQQNQERVEEADDLYHTLRQVSVNSSIKAAIHLEGYKRKNPVNPYDVTVRWSASGNQALVQKSGLQLEHNQIVVPKKGLYFVYSQLSFQLSCSDVQTNSRRTPSQTHPGLVTLSQTHPGLVTLSQTVMCHSEAQGKSSPLLHAIRTTCEGVAPEAPDRGLSHHSVYAGAVFRLHGGDRLSTEANATFLSDKPWKNFFGVFAL